MGLPSGQLASPLSSRKPTVNPGAEFGMGGGTASLATQPTPSFASMPSTVIPPAPLTDQEVDALRRRILRTQTPGRPGLGDEDSLGLGIPDELRQRFGFGGPYGNF